MIGLRGEDPLPPKLPAAWTSPNLESSFLALCAHDRSMVGILGYDVSRFNQPAQPKEKSMTTYKKASPSQAAVGYMIVMVVVMVLVVAGFMLLRGHAPLTPAQIGNCSAETAVLIGADSPECHQH